VIATVPPSPGSVGNGMHSSVRALIMVISLFFAWGFIIVLNGPLIAKLKGLFSLNYTEAMLTRFVFFLGSCKQGVFATLADVGGLVFALMLPAACYLLIALCGWLTALAWSQEITDE
jgi:fucose permease